MGLELDLGVADTGDFDFRTWLNQCSLGLEFCFITLGKMVPFGLCQSLVMVPLGPDLTKIKHITMYICQLTNFIV